MSSYCPSSSAHSRRVVLETEHNQLLLGYFDTKPMFGLEATNGGLTTTTTTLRSRDEFYRLLSTTADPLLPSKAGHVEVMVRDVAGDGTVAEEYWRYLVVTGLRGGRAKKMACHQNTRHLKLVPVGNI